MDFLELIEKVNGYNPDNINEIVEIVNGIDINDNNFKHWVEDVFSEKVNSFDMEKLPYLIDELYKSNNKLKFVLCCMLLESTCDRLDFVTNLENYPLFEEKYKALVNTLATVYEHVDNGIANCMSLIILQNDPKFSYFNDEQKQIILEATRRKLQSILDYLKGNEDINPLVYNDLELIVDMACYLNNDEISNLIDEIDNLIQNNNADVFLVKYKLINNLNVLDSKINRIINSNDGSLCVLYGIIENLNLKDKYLSNVTQEMVAKANMVKWLAYPTEFGSIPDKIELLGDIELNDEIYYAYKFSKENFRIKGDLIGVAGGYPKNVVTSRDSGFTFSKFEIVTDNWKKQAEEIIDFISDCWKNRANN